MPRVPTVDGPSADVAPLPGAYSRASSAAGSGAMQQADRLRQVGGALVEGLARQQNQRDLDAVFRAETALKDDYLKFEQDELGKRGANADGAADRSKQWWEEAGRTYTQGLNDRQQFAFRRSFEQLRLAGSQTLMRHARREADNSLAESSQARIGAAINTALADPSPERLDNSRREIVEAVSIVGNMAGYTEEVKAAKLGEALTLMHRGVVMQLADTDPDAARAYFYGNKKEIQGGTQLELEKVVQRAGKLQKAQTVADEIFANGMPLNEAMAYVEKNYSGEDEKDIKAEVQARWTSKKQGEAQIVSDAYGTAMLAVAQGRRVPATAWSAMDDAHRAAIVERQRAEQKRREAEADGRQIKTDFGTWDRVNRMVTSDPAGFAALDLERYADKVSRQDLMEFAGLQRKIRAGDDKPVKEVGTLIQQIDGTIASPGVGITLKGDKKDALHKAVFDAINDEQRASGKELTYDERQKVIDRQVIEMLVPGRLWGTNEKRAFELTPAERAAASIKVPDADYKAIEARLRAAGKASDKAAVLKWYRDWKGL